MREGRVGQLIKTVAIVAIVYSAFCLLAAAIFALIVRSLAPSSGIIVGFNWVIKCVGLVLCGLFFVRGERTLLRGAASGVFATLICMILFGLIGGFSVTPFFLLELLFSAVVCGGASRLGSYFRKD